jgi:hypothetical protein
MFFLANVNVDENVASSDNELIFLLIDYSQLFCRNLLEVTRIQLNQLIVVILIVYF